MQNHISDYITSSEHVMCSDCHKAYCYEGLDCYMSDTYYKLKIYKEAKGLTKELSFNAKQLKYAGLWTEKMEEKGTDAFVQYRGYIIVEKL